MPALNGTGLLRKNAGNQLTAKCVRCGFPRCYKVDFVDWTMNPTVTGINSDGDPETLSVSGNPEGAICAKLNQVGGVFPEVHDVGDEYVLPVTVNSPTDGTFPVYFFLASSARTSSSAAFRVLGLAQPSATAHGLLFDGTVNATYCQLEAGETLVVPLRSDWATVYGTDRLMGTGTVTLSPGACNCCASDISACDTDFQIWVKEPTDTTDPIFGRSILSMSRTDVPPGWQLNVVGDWVSTNRYGSMGVRMVCENGKWFVVVYVDGFDGSLQIKFATPPSPTDCPLLIGVYANPIFNNTGKNLQVKTAYGKATKSYFPASCCTTFYVDFSGSTSPLIDALNPVARFDYDSGADQWVHISGGLASGSFPAFDATDGVWFTEYHSGVEHIGLTLGRASTCPMGEADGFFVKHWNESGPTTDTVVAAPFGFDGCP